MVLKGAGYLNGAGYLKEMICVMPVQAYVILFQYVL
jgi:hypothetical protein